MTAGRSRISDGAVTGSSPTPLLRTGDGVQTGVAGRPPAPGRQPVRREPAETGATQRRPDLDRRGSARSLQCDRRSSREERHMDKSAGGDITGLLEQWRNGDRAVEARIVDAVYGELHQIAQRYARRERRGHSLQATALVNEAYVRLVARRSSWKNRAQFFGVAATLMRRILIDHARRSRAGKRGDGIAHVALDDELLDRAARANLSATNLDDVIAVDEALTRLAAVDGRQGRIVELRFFAGMTSKEIAEVLGIGERTVDREWAIAQAWLYVELRKRPEPPAA
ncbi:MAG: sigma-70 family RNA polymerase sigma factor [Acidobacteriota bacterium]